MYLTTTLLDHQKTAFEKLKNIKVFALYMDPGTGKTRTTLEFIKHHMDAGRIDCVLWFCPCSVRANLKLDIAYHSQGDAPIVIKGIESISSSDRLYAQCLKLVQTHKVMLVVDESDLVKNFFAKRTQRIIELSQKSVIKCILNGTPVSKNEADMFAQWYILDHRILGYKSYYQFSRNHLEYKKVRLPDGREVTTDQVIRVHNKSYLTTKIAPYTYQITKSECLDLPDKIYKEIPCYMTRKQNSIYKEVKYRFLGEADDFKPETIYKTFTALQHVSSGRSVISEPSMKMETRPIFEDPYDNPRLMALIGIIKDLQDEKVIIYTKFQSEADEISSLLKKEGKSCVQFTGKISYKYRVQYMEDFRKDVQVFISNKACGAYGLNLQFCHNIIFYDNDFNYGTREQAEDRGHRLGQTEKVYIYDIVADSSIDYMILRCLKTKTSMVEAFRELIHKYKDKVEITINELKKIS